MSLHRPNAFSRHAAMGALLVSLNLAGCYTYRPAEPPAPLAGQEVRVELTGAGRDHLRSSRALDMSALDGRFLNGDMGEVALQVRLDADRLGFGSGVLVDTIRVPRADVRSLGVKELSVGRTILAAAGVAAVAAGAYAAFGSGDGGPGGNPPPDQITLIPLSLTRLLGGLRGALR